MNKLLTVAALTAGLTALPAQAAPIVLAPGAVVGDTGSYDYPGTGHPGSFAAGRIFDAQTGPINGEAFTQGYWINGDNGPAAAFITFDLGATYSLTSFDLFNTSNGGLNDRGTGDFTILGSNTLAADGDNGFTLLGGVTVASGTLTAEVGSGPRTAQSFAATGSFRYLQFRPTSVASAQPIVNGIVNNYGLNELRVFGDPAAPAGVPEPASWALMIAGFGAVGGAMRRRSSRVAFAAG